MLGNREKSTHSIHLSSVLFRHQLKMEFSVFSFKVNNVLILIGFASLLFLPMVSFSSASIILKSDDDKLQQYDSLNQKQATQGNIKFLMANVLSRLDFMEKDINWLKTENQLLKKQSENQKYEIDHLNNQKVLQGKEIAKLKSSIEHLLDEQYEKYSLNQGMGNVSLGISNKRTVRAVSSVTPKPAVKKTTATTKPTMKPQAKSAITDTASTSWAKIEISDRVIGYMGYDTYTVKIFDHASNREVNMKNEEKKYYFEPIGQLNHLSAESAFNNFSKKYEMTFNINMWDDTVRDAVHKFISEKLKLGPVNKNLVNVLPLDNVVLYSAIGSSSNFEIEQDWIDYKSDQYLTFKFICDAMKPCEDLALQMKSNPKQFRLKMRFSMSSQNSQTRETKISIESIMHGDMMNKLDQKYKGREQVLLTADGKKELMKETSENVIIQTIDDSTEVPSQKSKDEIYRRLEKMLDFSRTTIQKGDENAWKNVFWNDDNYRPDKSAKTMNELYKKSDKENQNKLASSYSNTNKVDTEIGGSGLGFTANAKLAADFSRAGTDNKETLEKLFDEAKKHVEWDGVKFVPKQMELYSMNMARLRDKKAFTDTDIRVSYKTSMLSIDVRFDLSLDSRTSSKIFELETKLSGLDTRFASFVFDFKKELNELQHVKRKRRSSSKFPPSSCQNLAEMGHYLDGLYAIKERGTKKVQAVYCQFEPSSVLQEPIGTVDVKTKSVHFYVYNGGEYKSITRNAPIPFELAIINEGDAFNLTSGIFTVPVAGIYHFYFSALIDSPVTGITNIQVDGKNLGYVLTTNTVKGISSVSLGVSMRLAAGSKVNLFHSNSPNKDELFIVFFSGWLVEEDLIYSAGPLFPIPFAGFGFSFLQKVPVSGFP